MSSAPNKKASPRRKSFVGSFPGKGIGQFSTEFQRMSVLVSGVWARLLAAALLLFLAQGSAHAQAAHSVGEVTTFGSGFSNPHAVVVDPAGNLYVADYNTGNVYEEALQADGTYTQTVLFPSNGYGSAIGLARDSSGNFYIAGNGVVTKETARAGGGYLASTIGKFTDPVGVAVDPAGDVFVADDNESSLYELSAGTYAQTVIDFNTLPTPYAVSIDSSGNLYVGTVRGAYIEKYTLNQGAYNKSNVLNAPSTYGVIADDLGNLFYASPSQFMKATLSNGTYSEQVYYDYRAQAVTQGPDRELYAVSYFESTGVRLNPAPSFGSVPVGTTATRQITISFTVDVAGTFGTPAAMTQGAGRLDYGVVSTTCSGALSAGTGCTVTVAFKPTAPGLRSGGVNLVDANGNVLASAPISGVGTGPQGVIYPGTPTTLTSGPGTSLRTGAVATDGGGDVYAATSSGSILKQTRANGGYTQSTLGSGIGNVSAMAVDGLGNLFVADSAQQQVVEEIFQPSTGTYTQLPVFTASVNGLGQVGAVAVDGSGTVYLGNGDQLLKEVPYGSGYVQSVVSSSFTQVVALTVDGAGDVFAADAGTGSIYKEIPAAGGTYSQTAVVTGLGNLNGLGLDAAGTLYVTAPGLSEGVLRYAAAGNGTYQPLNTIAGFASPRGVALDGAGNLYVTAEANGANGAGGTTVLFRLDVADPQTLTFPLTTTGSRTAAQTVTLMNIGNVPLALSGIATSSANFSVDAATTTCTATGSLALAASCVAGVAFTPQLAGPLTGTLNITDNTLNQPGAVQTVLLSAAGIGPVTVAVSNLSVVDGTASATLTATVTYAGTVAPSGGLTFVVDNGPAVTASCNAGASVLTCTSRYSTATLAVGAHTITASEAADTYYSAATGTGTLTVTMAPALDFSFTNSGTTTATIDSGASATYTFQLAPSDSGFPGGVTLTVSGLPPQATYKLTPSSVAASSGQQLVQLTIQTAAPTTTTADNVAPSPPWAKGAAVLTAMLLPFGVARHRRRWMGRSLAFALAMLVSVAAITGLTGCGFLGYAYQSPGSFVVTVTATSGSVQHSAAVNLTVQ